MLHLLWHLRGSVELDSTTSNIEVLDRLADMLEKQRKPTIERGSNSIIFKESLLSNFWGPNWRATVMYDYGRLWIEQEGSIRKLRYDLSSLQVFLFVLFGATVFFFFGAAGGDFAQGLKFAALAFGWIYGMNLLLAVTRVPSLIRRTARTK